MMRGNKNFWVITVLLSLSALISWKSFFSEYHQQDTVDIHQFPKQIGAWTSSEMEITEEEFAILETRNAFARRYVNNKDGREVYILIVYSQHNRKVSHPPEICYTGNGAAIINKVPVEIKTVQPPGMSIHAERLLLEEQGSKEVSFYWFKVGKSFTSNYWKQQSLIVLKTLMGQPAGNALIRISTRVSGGDVDTASRTVASFTQLILPSLIQYLP